VFVVLLLGIPALTIAEAFAWIFLIFK
jgi:hypothetical protein